MSATNGKPTNMSTLMRDDRSSTSASASSAPLPPNSLPVPLVVPSLLPPPPSSMANLVPSSSVFASSAASQTTTSTSSPGSSREGTATAGGKRVRSSPAAPALPAPLAAMKPLPITSSCTLALAQVGSCAPLSVPSASSSSCAPLSGLLPKPLAFHGTGCSSSSSSMPSLSIRALPTPPLRLPTPRGSSFGLPSTLSASALVASTSPSLFAASSSFSTPLLQQLPPPPLVGASAISQEPLKTVGPSLPPAPLPVPVPKPLPPLPCRLPQQQQPPHSSSSSSSRAAAASLPPSLPPPPSSSLRSSSTTSLSSVPTPSFALPLPLSFTPSSLASSAAMSAPQNPFSSSNDTTSTSSSGNSNPLSSSSSSMPTDQRNDSPPQLAKPPQVGLVAKPGAPPPDSAPPTANGALPCSAAPPAAPKFPTRGPPPPRSGSNGTAVAGSGDPIIGMFVPNGTAAEAGKAPHGRNNRFPSHASGGGKSGASASSSAAMSYGTGSRRYHAHAAAAAHVAANSSHNAKRSSNDGGSGTSKRASRTHLPDRIKNTSACRRCHISKVKCDDVRPCSRCLRLSFDCEVRPCQYCFDRGLKCDPGIICEACKLAGLKCGQRQAVDNKKTRGGGTHAQAHTPRGASNPRFYPGHNMPPNNGTSAHMFNSNMPPPQAISPRPGSAAGGSVSMPSGPPIARTPSPGFPGAPHGFRNGYGVHPPRTATNAKNPAGLSSRSLPHPLQPSSLGLGNGSGNVSPPEFQVPKKLSCFGPAQQQQQHRALLGGGGGASRHTRSQSWHVGSVAPFAHQKQSGGNNAGFMVPRTSTPPPPLVGGGFKREATAAFPPPMSSSSSSSPVLPKKRSSISLSGTSFGGDFTSPACLSTTASAGATAPSASPSSEEAEPVLKRMKLEDSPEPPNASIDAGVRGRSSAVPYHDQQAYEPCTIRESSRDQAMADAQVSMDVDQIGPPPSDVDAPNDTTLPSASARSQCSQGSQGARRQSPVPMTKLSASFGSISLATSGSIAMLADVAEFSSARRLSSQKKVTKQPADVEHASARNTSAISASHELGESHSAPPSLKTPATASRSRDEDDDSCCGPSDPTPSITTSVDEAAEVICNMSKHRQQKNGGGRHGHRDEKVEHHRDRDQPHTLRRVRTSEVDHSYDRRDDVGPPPSSRRRRHRRHYSHASGLYAADFALDDGRRDGGNGSRSNSLSGSDGEHDDRHHQRPHHSMSSSAHWRSSRYYSGGVGMHRDRTPDDGGGALHHYSSSQRARRASYSARNSHEEYHPAPRSDSHLPARMRKPSAHEQRLRAHAQAHAGKKRDRSAMELDQRHPRPKLPAVLGSHFFGEQADRDGGDDDELSPPPALRQKHYDSTHANGHGTPEHPHGGAGGRTSYTSRSRQRTHGGSNPHRNRHGRSASISSNSSSGSVPSMMHPPAHACSSSAALLTYEQCQEMRESALNHKPLTRSSARKRNIKGLFDISIICERDSEPVRLTARIDVNFFNARNTRHTAVSASSGDTPAGGAAVVGPAPSAGAAPSVGTKLTMSSSSNSMATIPEEDGTVPAAARGGEDSEKQMEQPPQQPQQQQSGPSSEFATPRLPPHGRGRARRGPPVLADDLSDDDFGPGPRLRQRLFASPRQHVGSTHPPTNGDARRPMLGCNGNGRSSHHRSARGPSPTSGTARETSRPSGNPSSNTRGSAPSRNTRGSATSGSTRGSAPASSMNGYSHSLQNGRDLYMNSHGLPQAHVPMLDHHGHYQEHDDEMEPLGHRDSAAPGAGHQQHLQGGAGTSTGGGRPNHKTTHDRIRCASCVRCWAWKTKCSVVRPCKGCINADIACEVRPCASCIEQGTEHKCDSRKPCTPCRERDTKCGNRMVWSDKKRIPLLRRRLGPDGRDLPPAVPISKRPLAGAPTIAGGLPPSPSASPPPPLHPDMIAEIARNSAAACGGGDLSSPVEFNTADADELKLPPQCVGHNSNGGGHSDNGGCNNNVNSGGSANDAAAEAGPTPPADPADETMGVSSVSISGLPRAGAEPPLPTLPPAPVIVAAASAKAATAA